MNRTIKQASGPALIGLALGALVAFGPTDARAQLEPQTGTFTVSFSSTDSCAASARPVSAASIPAAPLATKSRLSMRHLFLQFRSGVRSASACRALLRTCVRDRIRQPSLVFT